MYPLAIVGTLNVIFQLDAVDCETKVEGEVTLLVGAPEISGIEYGRRGLAGHVTI